MGETVRSVVTEVNADELGLGDYVALYRRRWRWVAVPVLVVVGLVAVFTFTRDEVYESTTEVTFLTEGNQSVLNVREPDLFRSAFAELAYVSGDRYQAEVADLAGFDVDYSANLRVVDSDEDTEEASIIRITVSASSPEEAVRGATAAADAYVIGRDAEVSSSIAAQRENAIDARQVLRDDRDELNAEIADLSSRAAQSTDPVVRQVLLNDLDVLEAELKPTIDGLSGQIGDLNAEIRQYDNLLEVLDTPNSVAFTLNPAELPEDPVSPDVPRNLLVGLLAGFVLGLIFAIVRDLLDTRARDSVELAQQVEVPVMATIGQIHSDRAAPGRVRRYRDLSAEESSGYQVLLNSLWLANIDDPLQSIVFTSDRPGVGKTQTVVNLAQAEAARGTRVLVIDTDFVNPSVAARLETPLSERNLVDLLTGSAPIESVVVPTEVENLHIIDAKGAPSGGELLRSDRLGALLADLYADFDLILIDSPPTLSTSDSRLVASQADAVVVVYDPSESRREDLGTTIDLLRGAKANLVGLVANRSRAAHPVYLSARER